MTEPEFARTYDGGAYDDAWAAVKQYRRVIAYHRDNPDAGIAELMRISGAPRNSVVSWIDDGATPLVTQGLYKAHDYKLLEVDYDEITPLNILVAAALSAGRSTPETTSPRLQLDRSRTRWSSTASS
ncbi:hypothetical protein A6E15_10665 [Natrinema saccharevitans]|uniref:Uncharacterized protein n=1 Tax=Natrinema saccharevitans TaxID=301967 RepID=A0A1S8AXZ0_9EURY|nr:hypothetical protein A6E15_10665 [Natrinema saccharevitans]